MVTDSRPGASRYPLIAYRNVKLFHPGFGVPLDGKDKHNCPFHTQRVQEKLWEERQDRRRLRWGQERLGQSMISLLPSNHNLPSLQISLSVSVSLSICCPSIHLPLTHQPIHSPIHPATHLPFHPSIQTFAHPPTHLPPSLHPPFHPTNICCVPCASH